MVYSRHGGTVSAACVYVEGADGYAGEDRAEDRGAGGAAAEAGGQRAVTEHVGGGERRPGSCAAEPGGDPGAAGRAGGGGGLRCWRSLTAAAPGPGMAIRGGRHSWSAGPKAVQWLRATARRQTPWRHPGAAPVRLA